MSEYITYEMFGAVGDGIADDMPAIARAHAEANRRGLPVRAGAGAVYYISPRDMTAMIMTDTDWTGAKFTIDDRDPENTQAPVFRVVSGLDGSEMTVNIDRLHAGQTALSGPIGRNAFVVVQNENHRDYIRRGLNQNSGHPRTDCFIVNADGSLASPVAYDFDTVTSVAVYPMDEKTLTICGGEFTTIANTAESKYVYHKRNIEINRSNTVMHHVKHFVTDEGDHGAPYTGFVFVRECARVHVHDCVLTAHFTYWTIGAQGLPVPMGSYDINCRTTAEVRFSRCSQTTDIMDERYWGIIGTNYCRDMVFEDCVFSRFDAHMGVYNCTLRRCVLGWQCLNAIGAGRFLIEDTRACGRNFVYLRFDYGCNWLGDIIIRNCTWQPLTEGRNIIGAENDGVHDFGYVCHITRNVEIDGLRIIEDAADDRPVYVFADYLGKEDIPLEERRYMPVPPVSVKVRNIGTARCVRLCEESALMPETEFIAE